MKKTIILLGVILMTILMSACGESQSSKTTISSSEALNETTTANTLLTDDAVREMIKPILDSAFELYSAYQLGGLDAELPAEGVELKADGNSFYPVKSDKFKTIADLKEATEKVYTKRLSEEIYSFAFDSENPRYKEIDGVLNIDTNIGGKGYGRTLLTDTAAIVAQTDRTLTVQMDFTEIDGTPGQTDINLVKEDGNWHLDTDF